MIRIAERRTGALPSDREAVSGARAAWRTALGPEAVLDAEAAHACYARNTVGLERSIQGALRPADQTHVQALVRIAAEFGVPLFPIGAGRNWGYGCASPSANGCVIVDCSRMRRISMDPELGLVTVEPGVTQGQLAEYLDARNLPYLVPVTGAGPDASLLGNVLERGYGITPYPDHFAAVTSLEAVLPDGSLYTPTLAAAGCERADRAYRWGLGPYLNGLFTQFGLGIVTQVTLALAPRPERVEAFFFSLPRGADLGSAAARLRDLLRRCGSTVSALNLMNARRILSMFEPYPTARVPDGGTMPQALVDELMSPYGKASWLGVGCLYGTHRTVRAAKAEIRRLLHGWSSRPWFVTPAQACTARKWAERLPLLKNSGFARRLQRLDETLRIMNGRPSSVALRLAYWRSRHAPDAHVHMNPSRDGSGLLWYSPLVPLGAADLDSFAAFVERTCLAHGIEPLITLTTLSDRCCDSTIPLLFRRDDPAEAERAHACYEALLKQGLVLGFPPYRLPVHAMPLMVKSAQTCWRMSRSIKQALDPQNIMAPGRYDSELFPQGEA